MFSGVLKETPKFIVNETCDYVPWEYQVNTYSSYTYNVYLTKSI